ncbi:MAG: SufBD protein [Parcubacteria group bacterium GW2011_GWA2_49_9]|nr:MAG: SufBD protein [Parcubacteria group bacterium GW2011_GWA2_49_9]
MRTITINVKENEHKIFPLLWVGDTDAHMKVRGVLNKPNSSLRLFCAFLANKHTYRLETEIIHTAKNTFSRTLVKGVLDGAAVLNYEGDVIVRKGAKQADADLMVNTLMLSPLARAHTLPKLHVAENEVKAGHGATVGKIDEEQLFYITSRGLTIPEAKQLIIKGFFESMLSEFPKKEALMISNAVAAL